MSTDPKTDWSYIKKRKKHSGASPGPDPSGMPLDEQHRQRGARYRRRLVDRGLVSLHILVPMHIAQDLRTEASERRIAISSILLEKLTIETHRIPVNDSTTLPPTSPRLSSTCA